MIKILAIPTLLLSLIVLILLAAMNPQFESKGQCKAYTQRTIWTPMPVGNSVVLMPINSSSCIEWEYPNGKPISYPLGSGH